MAMATRRQRSSRMRNSHNMHHTNTHVSHYNKYICVCVCSVCVCSFIRIECSANSHDKY